MANKKSSQKLEDEILKTKNESRKIELQEIFLNKKDMESLVESAEKNRDKGLIALLWETGSRLGELYDLNVGSLENWEHGKKVVIDGYTGKRILPLVDSASILEKWLSEHPKGDVPAAPLWYDLENGNGKISYNYIRQMLEKTGNKAGINKPVEANHFRRSRMAYLSDVLSDEQIRDWFGWTDKPDLSGIKGGCSDCSGCPFKCTLS